MDPNIADLLGLDLSDPAVQLENDAVARDMDFIESLVALRKRRGLTQQDVAEQVGCSQPAISDFERLGGDPHLSTVRRYALAVGALVDHRLVDTVQAQRPRSFRSIDVVRNMGAYTAVEDSEAQVQAPPSGRRWEVVRGQVSA